jgi:hypothetical protein
MLFYLYEKAKHFVTNKKDLLYSECLSGLEEGEEISTVQSLHRIHSDLGLDFDVFHLEMFTLAFSNLRFNFEQTLQNNYLG